MRRVHIMLKEEEVARLSAIAAGEECSLAELVRRALRKVYGPARQATIAPVPPSRADLHRACRAAGWHIIWGREAGVMTIAHNADYTESKMFENDDDVAAWLKARPQDEALAYLDGRVEDDD